MFIVVLLFGHAEKRGFPCRDMLSRRLPGSMAAGSVAQLFGCWNHQFGIGIGIGINPPNELPLRVHLARVDLRTAPFEERRPLTTLQDTAYTEI